MELPLHSSVEATAAVVYPPKANADVRVPAPAKLTLAIFRSATSDQFAPFQSSVTALVPGPPPKTNAPSCSRRR